MRHCIALTFAALLACASDNLDDHAAGTSTTTSEGDASTTTRGDGPLSLGEDTIVPGETVGSSGEPVCGEQEFMLAAVPPNVMLVLDKSGSMMTLWDADGDPGTAELTRWHSLVNVVDFVVEGFDAEINFGANLFPSVAANTQLGAGACVVANAPEVPVAQANGAAVLLGIPAAEADDLHGATPATAGVQVARDHLQTLDPDVGRFMIVVTDGAANCSADADTRECPGIGCGLLEQYDANLGTLVADAFAIDGIPSFVVGIDILDEITGIGNDGSPEVNTFDELNLVAEAGGKARVGDEKFFNARSELELQSALAEIAGQVASCIVPLAEPGPVHPDFVEIEIGGNTVPRVDDCASEDGWVYVEPDGPYDAIELCGTACDQLADIGMLGAIFGCPPAG
ncbi:MAG: VWA domain-containing protein [Deltaproteobacteria bacterium]|nr:VWA domain-containing protein [Nannocystaceae bacterium]